MIDGILYHSNKHKKINGTLFYSFEYFLFLKNYIPDIKLFLINTDENDILLFKEIFKDKYSFNHCYLDDIIFLSKFIPFLQYEINKLIILDIHSYTRIRDFLGKTKKVFVYSNEEHNFLNDKNTIFYGWYDYQNFHKKTRIKLYKEVHKTFNIKGNKIFVTSSNANNSDILRILKLDNNETYTKELNSHNSNMFEHINKMIYWHSGNRDTNNRAIVESYIHNIPLVVYFNENFNDSIFERTEAINNGRLSEMFIDENDILIQDFLKKIN